MAIVVIQQRAAGRATLAKALAAEGFQVQAGAHVDEVRAATLVLLAASVADAGVLSSIGALRLRHPEAIVLVATDHDSFEERLACYEAGADDCLPGPYRLDEVSAKLRAWQRRRSGASVYSLLPTGDATVDTGALELKVGPRSQSLTKREAELLAILARADGAPVPRERVLREAWGGPAWMTNNSVDVYVGYVRRKLDLLDSDVTVKTVRGLGFQLSRRKARRSSAPPPLRAGTSG
ncbi:response regulator transcription factor [Methylopila sp. M107]|uniref:response regulator transcription factor n=1 Tax=Methylopila sp. M107 TaxID=1101190 RepID=UPI00037C3BCC|nr:response regulator transcription factor [Methylopila sp. M107]